MMAKIISLISCKGGISKTTSTVNIGTVMAMHGKRVLMLDNDPQYGLTKYLQLQYDSTVTYPQLIKGVIERIPRAELQELIKSSIRTVNGFDIIPSDLTMCGLEMLISMATRREYILSDILSYIKDQYDFILLDCLPSLGIFAVNALTASDSVLIPVETHIAAFEGFDQILETMSMIREYLNPGLKIEGVIIAKHQENTGLGKEIRKMIQDEYGQNMKVFDTPIPLTIKVANAWARGTSVVELYPKHPASIAYQKIAQEVEVNA